MNQILSTKLNKNINTNKKQKWFKFQFAFSIFSIFALLISGFMYLNNLKKKANLSNNLISNYNISKLYSNSNLNKTETPPTGVFGIIEIPKINLYYPVFSNLTENLLKISPCKFYGDTPNVNGNICIAGHNYDNSLFFSNISNLAVKDEIRVYDSKENLYVYVVYDVYEVEESDLSPIFNYNPNEKILTLITCNNINQNRVIVKAKQN